MATYGRVFAGLLLLGVALVVGVNGHGYLYDPPGRATMWRLGFDTVKDYDDNAINCGGSGTQYNGVNQGRCGECGDPWSMARPRKYEEGGDFAKGVIGQVYTPGQVIAATVRLTANHKGFFEFKLCPEKKTADELPNQECFDRYLLPLMDGSTRYQVDSADTWVNVLLKLPDGVTCEYCVFQWTYTAGNNNPDVNEETFRNCADIAIRATR